MRDVSRAALRPAGDDERVRGQEPQSRYQKPTNDLRCYDALSRPCVSVASGGPEAISPIVKRQSWVFIHPFPRTTRPLFGLPTKACIDLSAQGMAGGRRPYDASSRQVN